MRQNQAKELVARLVDNIGYPSEFGETSAEVVEKLQENDIEEYYVKQIEWSKKTFGDGKRTKGLIEHITKELKEIEDKPYDLEEWIDVVVLGMDGFWRHGGRAEDFMMLLQRKQVKNFARKWPEPKSEDEAVEHIREEESK